LTRAVPIVLCKPPARSAQSAHVLVAHQQESVAIADIAQALKISIGRNDQAVGARHSLDENRGDGVRAFVHEGFFDLRETSRRECRVAVAFAIEMAAIFVWIEEADDGRDRKSTRLNSSHLGISYAVFCLKKKKK